MKTGIKIFLGFIGVIVLFLALELGFGWFGVFYTKTVGKAKENARREVFEETQSYVEGKRQELIKYRLEYMRADSSDKEAIKMTIVQSFANFDEDKHRDKFSAELISFLKEMKYKN